MNIVAHLLITLLFAKIADLSGMDFIWAVMFGVCIDFDHIIKVPLYLKQNGLKIVRYWNWRTGFQEPISYLWIVPLSLYFQTWIPMFFFTTHIVLDYLMSYEKQPFYPLSNFTIKERKTKIDDPLGIIAVVVTLCMFVFLV